MKKILIFLLTALCVIALCACNFSGLGSIDPDNSGSNGNDDSGKSGAVTEYKRAGTYEVGKDIEAAEYLLICTGSISGYLEVTLTKNASIGSADFLYNEAFSGRRYVIVHSGEFLKFSSSKLYKLDATPELKKESDKGYPVGQYKVGRDIAAAEYLIVDPSENSFNYVEQLTSPNASPLSSEFLFNETFTYRHYVKTTNGQYISFSHGKLYEVAEAPEVIKLPSNQTDGLYKPGQYKVGTDLSAGNHGFYVPEGSYVYYEITTLPLCSVMSDAFLKNGNLTKATMVALTDGQYIFFTSGMLILNPQVE
ncbi:MAG: hypothetical protein LBL66_09270 [Clostridiales bacterium]|jgi:hypothetical protein|nr:hypothetical protein [Clostridiales bacterium]